ncbi:hypothetical protein EVJ32_04650 [Exiguobacterium sp. SH5S4]|uniref:hypothetical protein n=1 Tax=Exiguobacterium sp. SH5S4 TaxID=2510961 RepID=UPI00103FA2CC|nr:hypothetical protein [Exiguobacterium sp. SH5S4]TCI26667.1 hypothetical protein EVJ32_04650 [Exiguobacterium sp. SH5S4]
MKTMTLLKQIARYQELDMRKHNVYNEERRVIENKVDRLKKTIKKAVTELFPELTEKVKGKNARYENDFYIHTAAEMLGNHKDGIVFIRNSGVDYFYKKSVNQRTMFDYYMAQIRYDHKEKRDMFGRLESAAKATNRTRQSDSIHMYKLENGVPVKRLSMDKAIEMFEELPTVEELEKKLNKNKELVTA